jgi:hypothetical protein
MSLLPLHERYPAVEPALGNGHRLARLAILGVRHVYAWACRLE